MKQSIYLHDYVISTLVMFGNLSDVINDVLRAVEQGDLPIEDLPECENRQGAKRCNVDVTNEYYLSIAEIYGVKSKRISLRRLLYYFVDNELYNELGWEPLHDYIDGYQSKINKCVDKILAEMTRLKIILAKNVDDRLSDVVHACDLINSCKR